jgi:predicted alpha/beta hydrolase family esterase
MKRAVLCHCWGGHPDFIWYPYLHSKLDEAGIKVKIPSMPDTDHPVIQSWLPSFSKAVGEISEDDILIGHSLGCATVLRFLESLSEDQKVGGVIMVAGFLDDRGDSEISSFFKEEFNYEKLKMRSSRFVSIHSDNDPGLKPDYFKHSNVFLSKLKAKIIIIPDGGHFSIADNCFEFPEVVNEVVSLVT